MKFFEFTTKVSEFPNFLIFRQLSNNFVCVAAGSVFERYQTRFCAHFSKNLFENVKFFFDLICEIFNIQKAPRYGVNLQRENIFAVSHVARNPENDLKTKMKTFSTSSKKFISSKVSKVTKRSPQDSGIIFPLQKTSKTKFCEKRFSKIVLEKFLFTR